MGRGMEQIASGDEETGTILPDSLGQVGLLATDCEQPDSDNGEDGRTGAIDLEHFEESIVAEQIFWKGRTLVPSDIERLYNTYETPVRSMIFRLLGSSEDARDLTQETFTRALGRLHNTSLAPVVVHGNTPSPWIYRIATNLALDALRRRKLKLILSYERIASIAISSGGEYEPARALAAAETDATGFEDSLIASMDTRETLGTMKRQDYADALVLYHTFGFSEFEIATVFGLAATGGKMFLSRAREKFRDTYNELAATA